MNRCSCLCLLAGLVVSLSLVSPAVAQVEVETLLDGLNNPCGVAVQPETGAVFVADSGGHRVVRIVDGKTEEVIVGFPQDVYGKGPMYNIGPLGLAFIGQNTLVVGGGGKPDGEEMLRVYEVPAAGSDPLQANDMHASFSLAPQGDIKGEGNFYGLAVAADGVYVTCNGDDTKGWVSRLGVGDGGKLGDYKRHIATKEATDVDAPVGITVSPRGELVVGQMGEITVPEDSLLTFYNPAGKMLLNLETTLFDITGLGYSPKGNLFATDFAWMATENGGLFRLEATNDDGEQGVKPLKITSLDKPTAMAFGADGALYITVLGTAAEGSNQKPGKLLKLTGSF